MYIEISRLEKENRYLGLNEKQKTAQILKDLRLFQQISAHNNAITDETN